jgi:peptidoglycan/LPS O-acetylase OafA/YrhL
LASEQYRPDSRGDGAGKALTKRLERGRRRIEFSLPAGSSCTEANQPARRKERVATRREIPALTGLRFWAAWLVLWDHTVDLYFKKTPYLQSTWCSAWIGMTLFFVLSGFVIHYNYGDTIASFRPSAVRSFLVARFARLYPLYLLAFLMPFAVWVTIPHRDYLWRALPFYLTLSQNWTPFSIGADEPLYQMYIFGAWSLSTEFMLYLLYFPIVGAICRARGLRPILYAIGTLVLVVTTLEVARALHLWGNVGDPGWFYYTSPYCRLPEFLLGALAAAVFMKFEKPPTKFESAALRTAAIVAVLFSAMLFIGGMVQGPDGPFAWYQRSWGHAPTCAILLFYFARNRSAMSWLVDSPPILVLGEASYSIYLLSGYMLSIFANGSSSLPMAFYRVLVAWVAVALFSLGSYQYFEAPARRFIRRLRFSKSVGRPTHTSTALIEAVIEAPLPAVVSHQDSAS